MTHFISYFERNLSKHRNLRFPLLVFLIVCITLSGCSDKEKDRAEMDKIVFKINQKCPTLIDSETQLDGIELKDEKTIIYKYTLIHATVMAIDTHQFYLNMWPGILSTIRVSPEMQKLRDNEMTVYYKYRDGYDKEIYTFKIAPKDYK